MTPAVELLHRYFPEAEISVLVRRGTEAVLENNPFIKQTYTDGEITSNQDMHKRTKSSLGKRLGQIPSGLRLIRRLRHRRFDLAVDFNGSDRAAIYCFLSGARRRVSYQSNSGFVGRARLFTHTYPVITGTKHRVLEIAELVALFAQDQSKTGVVAPTVGSLILRPTDKNLSWAEAEWERESPKTSPRVLLHPTSRVAYKCWAPAKWAEVVERLQTTFGAQVMVTCSPDPKEIELARGVLDLCATRPAERLGDMSLGQLAALIQRGDVFLGVDSAPMHMAAAVGTPVVAVFGPSSDAIWSPWGKNNRVIRRPCVCLDQRKNVCSPEKGMDCLNGIPVEEVFRAATEVLSVRPGERAKARSASASGIPI
jgi:heptosyltransferase-3